MNATTAVLMLVPHAILSPKRRHQLRQALPKSLWQKWPRSITRPVKLHQVREVLFEKRQEHSRRARLEEKRIGKDPLRARFARGFYQSLKVAWPIRDLRQHRCANYARVDARKIQLANCLQPQIGPRRPRLQFACQFHIDRGHGHIHADPVVLAHPPQNLDIARDHVRLGHNSNRETRVPRQFLDDCPRNLETPLRRLIRIRRRANRDLLPALDPFQLRPKQPRRLLLDENLSFKVHALPQFHELVRIARVAVLAGKLATAIRIDGPRERKIASAYHPAEQRSRPDGKVFNVVSLAQRLGFGGDPRDAHKFRMSGGFAGQCEERKSRHKHIRYLFSYGTAKHLPCQTQGLWWRGGRAPPPRL